MINYLEEEIDETLNALNIKNKKLIAKDINYLIKSLTKKFFKFESTMLIPMLFNESSRRHNSTFWQEIAGSISSTHLVLLVFDTDHRAWKLKDSNNLAYLMRETTGYPFWLTDRDLTFLIHLDDHDCVSST